MFAFLEPAKDAIIPGLEPHEITFAKHQPQYGALRALANKDGIVLTRWRLTPEQRDALETGADIFVECATFNKPLQPIRLAIGTEVPEEKAQKYRPQMRKAE